VSLVLGSIPGATGYNVYYKANSTTATTGDTKAAGSPFSTLNPVIMGLANGTQYAFVVTAINVVGEGAASQAAVVAPVQPVQMLSVTGGIFSNGTSLVTVSSFLMSKYEVTQAQYQVVASSNPSWFSGYTNRPVEQVTWYDAVEYCNNLSATEGLESVYSINGRKPMTGYPITGATVTADWTKNGYRLPTEAQWEWAARGGALSHGYAYSGSNTLDSVGGTIQPREVRHILSAKRRQTNLASWT
jgi:hypothetical protein